MSSERVVFEPAWEGNPAWGGAELYEDLAVAQLVAAQAYVDEVYEGLTEYGEGLGELLWVWGDGSWELTDGGVPSRPGRVRAASPDPALARGGGAGSSLLVHGRHDRLHHRWCSRRGRVLLQEVTSATWRPSAPASGTATSQLRAGVAVLGDITGISWGRDWIALTSGVAVLGWV
ncbi:hypothetical protein ACFWAD_29935 [Rhodococcus sp. NPDC059969]|uniref:hypothetical protein n=1 Tax=Rhodococcus sp. NPDC059969 TaxID=3347018 RepID=UPI003672D58E